jgi:gliding motility-associated-like protein
MKVSIFDRWGEKVAEWKGLGGNWNGRVKGNPAPKDVYFYKIDAVGSINPVIMKSGTVTLV